MDLVVEMLAQLLGVAVAAGGMSAFTALVYRWYVRERVQTGVAVLFGLTVVVLYLGTTTALGQVIGGQDEVLELPRVLGNISAFVVGGLGAYTGTRVGDRLGTDLFAATARGAVDADVSEIVQTVGRVTSVRLPEDVDDIVGYDPSPDATKKKLANRRFLFPRRLTKAELRERLVARLKTDYGVGHVDLELADDGTVEYLAIGSRAAGIGPTLPPATNAVAIRADPANAASAGDLVQVWERNPATRVLTGELRGVAGDVVTVAIDAADTPKLDPQTSYKLVTLPVQERPDREFASLLRAADETMGTATVGRGSEVAGQTVGALEVTVIAITRDGESPETIPSRERVLAAGDTLYAIATPDALRRLEQAAEGADEEPTEGGHADELNAPAGPATTDSESAVGESAMSDGSADETAADTTADDTETADTVADDAVGDTAEASGDEPSGDDPFDAIPDAEGADPLDELTEGDDGDDPVEVWDPAERIGDSAAGDEDGEASGDSNGAEPNDDATARGTTDEAGDDVTADPAEADSGRETATDDDSESDGRGDGERDTSAEGDDTERSG
ncbi:TrkA C-terminal domain-containing protein [Haloarcula salina]|uniref:Potassium transporter TrkA n=1 Tax=Haloarcula salina TaxID=1429914 RepID=A0AA41FX99_9EURY|nr:TrkA C-terminal domain-containing protein [Haloarcula salina]MBV0900500.1 potassium transporter TrkA [Haloarcula salina]